MSAKAGHVLYPTVESVTAGFYGDLSKEKATSIVSVAVNRSKQSTDKASIISFFIYKATCSESNVSKQRT